MTANRRRPGVTLIEVLMATGILAIGLLAILALFPIGAVNMARAITQSRSSDHAANSDAMFRVYWKQAWVDSIGGGVRATNEEAYQASQEPVLLLLDAHPAYGPIAGAGPVTTQPGFSVLVDPIGFQTNLASPAQQSFVAGNNQLPMRTTLRRCIPLNLIAFDPTVPPNFPRPDGRATLAPGVLGPITPGFIQPAYPTTTAVNLRLTTLLDDITFDKAGEPDSRTNQLERAGRYSAAWLVQRPNASVPAELHITVLVYAGRSPTDTPSAETPYAAQIPNYSDASPPQTILINYGVNQAKPGFRKGGFVAFSTMITPLNGVGYPSLDFYRIGGTQDDETTGTLLLDLERPVKGYAQNTVGLPPAGGNLNGIAIFFDNLVEVFDRGTVSATGVAGR